MVLPIKDKNTLDKRDGCLARGNGGHGMLLNRAIYYGWLAGEAISDCRIPSLQMIF